MTTTRSINEIKQDFYHLEQSLPTLNALNRPKTGTILDRDKSVKWNEEEIRRRQMDFDEAMENIRRENEKTRDRLYEELVVAIQDELGVSLESAGLISEFASLEAHNYAEEFCQLKQLIRLFKDVSAAEKAATIKM